MKSKKKGEQRQQEKTEANRDYREEKKWVAMKTER